MGQVEQCRLLLVEYGGGWGRAAVSLLYQQFLSAAWAWCLLELGIASFALWMGVLGFHCAHTQEVRDEASTHHICGPLPPLAVPPWGTAAP